MKKAIVMTLCAAMAVGMIGSVSTVYAADADIASDDAIKKAADEGWEIDMYPEFWTHIYKLGGHHGCFSVFYRRHPFCFCLDSFAIIVINIFINSNCKFFK